MGETNENTGVFTPDICLWVDSQVSPSNHGLFHALDISQSKPILSQYGPDAVPDASRAQIATDARHLKSVLAVFRVFHGQGLNKAGSMS